MEFLRTHFSSDNAEAREAAATAEAAEAAEPYNTPEEGEPTPEITIHGADEITILGTRYSRSELAAQDLIPILERISPEDQIAVIQFVEGIETGL